ncbi:Apolipophorin, partial [Frankliniella fusca]
SPRPDVYALLSTGPAALSSSDKGTPRCAAYCKQETDKISKFKYSPGTTYQYRYETLTETRVAGTGPEASRLHLSAWAEITPITLCDFVLRLRDVELLESSLDDASTREAAAGAAEFKKQLEAQPLRFAFQDGVVDELCPAQADPVWALNIKRGVLSAFQNAMPDFRIDSTVYETDVTGTCETHYAHDGVRDDNLLMIKTKNLAACAHRMDHYLSVQSTHYTSAGSALPLLRSNHTCRLALSYGGHLREAVCTETHVFRPFSSGESGARTDVTQKLTLVQTVTAEDAADDDGADLMAAEPRRAAEDAAEDEIARRTTLLFEHEDAAAANVPEGTAPLEAVTLTLASLATRTQDGVDKESAAMFARLVADLRGLKLDDLSKLFDKTEDTRQRRFLLDALPLVATAESLEAMLALWRSEELSGQEMDSWLASIPFQARAKPDMITALLPLLDGLPRPRALLAVSALVHRVCEGRADCPAEVAEVAVVVSRLERLLGADCRALGRGETDMVLLALRALGNAGVVSSPSVLARCYESTSNPLEVRLAALQAWRRAPCESHPTAAFLKLYTEQRLDVELRIAAYLAAMRCPSPSTLRVVKDVLYAEEVNQVASFVWTHLTNLQETASPWKQNLRELVESDFLKNKFKTDVRKFSRNYEGSLFFDKINAGVTAESNVIFSPQSYLPRSANLNLTVDVFGESVNLFELGARLEGFESVVEGLFAKGGAFPDEGVQAMLQNLRSGPSPTADAENSIAKLSSAFDARHRLPQEPHGELYARVFGNEMHYSRFHGLQELAENTDSFAHPMRTLLALLRRSEVDVTKSFVFLDAAYTLPTASGMPLELTANGSATLGLQVGHTVMDSVRRVVPPIYPRARIRNNIPPSPLLLQVRGRLDLSEMLSRRAALVEGRVAPSAALQVVANMGVNAHVTRTGLRTVSTLHSNTYLDGRVRVDGAKLVEVSLHTPRERVDVVEVTSRLYLLHREQPRELAGVTEDREETQGCTSATAATVTGMQLCGALSYANASRFPDAPYFPLTGPFNLSVGLLRTDTFEAYKFIYKLEHDHPTDASTPVSWSATFDTPGSRVNRRLRGSLWLDARQLSARAQLASPWAALEVSAKANLARDKRSLDVTVAKDGRELLALAASCVQTAGSRLEPTMSVAWQRRPLLHMRGAVSYVTNVKYSADLTVGGLTDKPVALSADLSRSGHKWDLTASARAADLGLEAGLQGSARWSPPSVVSAKITANYKVGSAAKAHDLGLSAKYQSNDKGTLSRKSASFNLQMTQWPQYNVVASVDAQRADRYWESSEQLGLGDTVWSAQQLYRNRHPNDHADLALKATLACPKKGVDYRLDLQHLTTDSSLSSHALLQYSRDVRWNALLEYGVTQRAADTSAAAGLTVYRLNAQLACPWRLLDLRADVAQHSRGRYQANAHGRYEVTVPNGPNVQHELVVNGSYVDNSTAVSLHHTLELDASFPKSAASSWAAPLRVTGAIVAANGRSRQWLLVERAGAKYRVDVDYTKNKYHVVDVVLRLDDKGYKGRLAVLNEATEKGVTIDLQFTKRFVLDTKISCDGEKHIVSVEMFWDKDVDPSKRVALHAEADSESNQAELAFPDQYIKLHVTKLPNGFTSVLEWTEGDRITLNTEWLLAADGGRVSARLTTPFQGYKLQTLAALYALEDNSTDARVDLTWRDQMLSVSVLAETLEGGLRATTQVTSSLAVLRNVTLAVAHTDVKNGTSRDMLSRAALDYNGRRTAAEAHLLATNIGVSGTASFVSPFELARSLSAKFALENDVYGDRGELEVSWAPERRAGAQFELMLGRNPHALLQIVTPFEGYEVSAAEFLYSTTASNVNLDLRAEFNRKAVSMALEGQRVDAHLKGKAEVKTPYTEPVRLTAEHSTKIGKIREVLRVAYAGRDVVDVDVGGDIQFPAFIDVTGKVSVPGHRIETVILSQVDSVGLTTELSGKWNKDTVSLRVENSLQRKDDATLTIDHKMTLGGSVLPRELVVALHHRYKTDAFYITNLALPGGIFLAHSLTLEDKTHWENSITVTTPSKTGTIVNAHSLSFDGTELEHTMTATFNGKKSKAALTYTKYSAGYIKSLEAAITTPISEPIKLKLDLPFEARNTCRPRVVLNYKDKTISAVSLVRFSEEGAHFDLQFDAPFCPPVRVDADVDLKKTPMTTRMMVTWEGKEMEIEASGELSKLKSGFAVRMNRPDLGMDVFQVGGKYDLMSPVKAAELSIGIDGREWFVRGSGGALPDKFQGNFQYHLPISEWDDMRLEGDIDLTKPTKLAVVSFHRANTHLILSGSAVIDRNAPRLSLSLDSKLPGINSADFLASYNKNDGNAHTVEVSYGQADFDVKLTGNLTTNDLSGLANIELLSPIKGHERMSMNFDYDLKGRHQKVIFKATRNDWVVVFDGMSNLDERGEGEASLQLNLPYEGVEELMIKLKQELDREKRSVNVVLTNNDKAVSLSGNVVTPDEGGVTISAALVTPFEGFQSIGGHLNVTSPHLQQKWASVSLHRNEFHFKASGQMNIQRLKSSGSITVTTPLDGYEGFESEFQYDVTGDVKSGRAEHRTVGGRTNTLQFTSKATSAKSGQAQAEVNLPSFGIPKIDVEGKFDCRGTSKNAEFEVLLDRAEKILSAKIEMEKTKLKAWFVTPKDGFKDVFVSGSVTSENDKRVIVVQVKNNNADSTLNIRANLQKYTSDITIDVGTPFEEWQTIQLAAQYDFISLKKVALFKLTKNGENIFDTSAQALLEWKSGEADIKLSTSFLDFSSLAYKGSYDFTEDYSAGISREKDGVSQALTGRLSLQDNGADVKVQTPFEGYEDVTLAGRYSGGEEKSAAISLETNGKKKSFEIAITNKNQIAKINMKTPAKDFETVSIVLNYGGLLKKSKSYSVDLAIKANEKTFLRTGGILNLNWESKIHLDAVVDIPLLGGYFDDLSVDFVLLPGLPPRMLRLILKNRGDTTLEMKSDIFNTYNGGFTATSYLLHEQTERKGKLEFYPREILIRGSYAANDRVVLSGEFLFDSTDNKINVEVKSPFESYEHVGLGWKHGKNYAQAWMKTPIQELEDLKAYGEFNIKEASNSSVKLSASRNDNIFDLDILIRYGYEFGDSHIAVRTSLKNYEKCLLGVKYDVKSPRKSATVRIERDENIYSISGDILVSGLIGDAVISVKTPHDGYKDVRIEGSYDFDKRGHKKVTLVGDFEDKRCINARFSFTYGGSKSSIEIISETPLPFATFSVIGDYDYAAQTNTWNINSSIKMGGVSAEVNSVIVKNKEGNLIVAYATQNEAKRVKVDWQLENGLKHKKAAFSVDMGTGRKIEAVASMYLDGFKNVETEVTITSLNSQTYSLTAQWNMARSNVIAGNIGLQWGPGKEIKLEGDLEIGESKKPVKLGLTLTSPFQNLENVRFSSIVTYENELILTSALEWDPTKRILLNSMFSHSPLHTKSKVEFTTPFTPPLLFTLKQDQAGLLEALFQLGDDKYELKGNVAQYSTRHLEVEFTLTTPQVGLSFLKLSGTYNLDGGVKLAKASFTKEAETAAIYLSFKAEKKQHSAKLAVTALDGREWEVSGMLNRTKGLESNAVVQWNGHDRVEIALEWIPTRLLFESKTPFKGFKSLKAVYLLDLSASSKKGQLNAQKENDEIDINFNVDLSKSDVVNFDIGLKTPFTEFVSASGTYKESDGHHVVMHVKDKRKQTKVEGKLRYDKKENQLDLHFESSKDEYKGLDIRAGYSFNGANGNKHAHLNMRVGETTVKSKVEGGLKSDSIYASLKIDSSIPSIKTVEAGINLHKNPSGFLRGILNYLRNDALYQIKGTGNYVPGNVRLQLGLEMPGKKIDNVFVIARNNNKSVNFVVGTQASKFEFEGTYDLAGPLYSVNATLKSPYIKVLEHVAVRTVVDTENLTGFFLGQWSPTEKAIAQASVRANKLLVKLETPFKRWETVQLSGEYTRNDLSVYDLESHANWNEFEIKLTGSLNSEPSDFGVKGHLEWSGNQKIDLDAKVQVEGGENLNNIQCKFRLYTPFSQMNRMELDFALDMSNKGQLKSRLALVTPFEMLPELRSTLVLRNDDYRQMSGLIEATALGREMRVGANISNDALQNVHLKLQVLIPFLEVPPITVEGSLNQREWRSVDSQIKVVLPKNTYHVGGNYRLEGLNLEAKCILTTPVINTELSFGGNLDYENLDKVKVQAYFGSNNISINYELKETAITGSINLNVPAFKVRVASLELKGQITPSIQAFVSYNCQQHSGSLSLSMDHKPDSLSTRVDLDLPDWLGSTRRTLQVSLKFPENSYSALITFESTVKHLLSVSLVNNKDTLEVGGHTSGPVLGEKNAEMKLEKNWGKLSVNLNDILLVDKNKNIGSITLKYKQMAHKIQYLIDNSKGMGGSIEMESPLIKAQKMTVNGNFVQEQNRVFAEIDCIIGAANHRGSLTLALAEDGKSTNTKLEVVSVGELIFGLDADASYDNSYSRAALSVQLKDTEHRVTIRHKRTLPLDSKLVVVTPLIGTQVFQAVLTTGADSILAYAGMGEDVTEHFVLLEAALKREKGQAHLNFKAPLVPFIRLLSFNTEFVVENSRNIKMNLGVDFKSDYANLQVLSLFSLNSTEMLAILNLQTPIEGLESLQASARIPLVLTKDMDAHVRATMPSGATYATHALFQNMPDRLEMSIGAQCKKRKLGAAFKLVYGPVYALEAEVNTPFQPYKHYRLDLKGQKSLIDGNDIVNYVEWNEQRIELRYSMLAASRKFETSVQLTTPFVTYERYALSLMIENNNRKALSIKISHPQLKQDLVVEFDYTFNGMSNVNLIARVTADIHPSFESASLLFGNKLNAANRSYTGLLFARYNKEEFSFSAEGMLKPGLLMSEIQANVNEKQLYFQAKGGVIDELIEVSLQLETPFEVIRDAEIFLQATNKKLVGTEARIVHNTHEYLGISIRRDESNVSTFEVRNSWRPVSASYLFAVAPEVNVVVEVCWDMNAKDDSIIRYAMHTPNWSESRREFTSTLQVPTRVMSVSGVLEKSLTRREIGMEMSIERDEVYGLSFAQDRDISPDDNTARFQSRGILRLPRRTLEVYRNVEVISEGNQLKVKRDGTEFLWDAAQDRDKKILLLVVRDSGSGEFRLHHAALEHDLVLRYKHGLHQVRAELEYSGQPEDMVVVEGGYKDEDGHLLTSLLVRHDASSVDVRVKMAGVNTPEKSTGLLNVKYLDRRTGQDRVLEVRTEVQHTQPAFEAGIFTNENKIIVNGKLWSRGTGSYRGMAASIQMNQRDPLSIKAHLNAIDDSPSINVDVQYGESRTYTLFAGMPNHREIKASAKHNLFGSQTIDGLFAMKLNTSKLFWTRASWRPGVMDELQTAVFQDYNDLLLASAAIYDGFTDFLREDVGDKWEMIYPKVISTLDVVIEYNNEEKEAIARDFPNILSKLKTHFEHNDFFVKDIWNFFSSTASMASSGASCVTNHTMELLDAAYSAFKGFTSMLMDILYFDVSGILDVIPVIKSLGQNAMVHWNATLTDLAALRNATHLWTRKVLRSAHDTLARLEDSVTDQMAAWDAFVEDVRRRVERAVVPALLTAQDVFLYINYHVTQIQEHISAFVEAVKTHLLSMDEVRELLSLYSQYASWLEDFHIQDYFDRWLAELSDTAEWVVRDLRQTYSDYKAYFDALYDAAFGRYEALNKLPPVAYVRKLAGKVYQKALWAWRYYDVTKEIGEGLLWLLHQVEVGLMDLVNHMDASSSASPTLEPSSSLILDKDKGLFEYTQTLPIHWHGFDRLPEFQELSPYRVAAEQTADISSLDKYRYYLLDALNEYRAGIKLSRFLPPYGATAMLVGRHHFMTFDKQFYDFAGECSYLLTSDFVNSKFSAIVNYEISNRKVQKKSLTVLSDGHSIEITANHRILVDGKKAETPVLVGDSATVTRDGDRVRVTSQHGLTVDCNLRYDVCALDITGWHFGRTGGLLGTYDNEPANDLALPTGELTGPDNLEGFADAWRVGRKQCRPANHAETAAAKHVDRGLAREAQALCASYFLDSDSSLAPCFPRVDPAPFRALCEADVKQQANSPARDRALCAPAAAYVEMCHRAGMELWVPQFCVRCDLPDGNVLAAGEVKLFKGTAPQSADVVFVVEQAACLRSLPVEELALKLDVALKRQGLTANRFAVVGFGGNETETFRAPHAISTEGQTWITGRHLDKAFDGLSMSADEPSPTAVQDAYDALWYAARLPFRAGVSKTLVLVACHECSGDASEQANSFSDAVDMLTDGDFSLHVLEPRAVRLRKAKMSRAKSGKAAAKAAVKEGRIFGADRQGVFTPRNVKSLQPSDQLKQVSMSKDLCTPLALETNGTVFNLDRMSNVALGDGPAIPVLNKRFLDVWSRRVAAHAQPANCQRCGCVADQDGSGRAICQNCLSPSLAQDLKEWDELTGEDDYDAEVEVEMDFPEYSDEDTDITKI